MDNILKIQCSKNIVSNILTERLQLKATCMNNYKSKTLAIDYYVIT